MSAAQQTADKDLVAGLGATGLSIARYLKRNDGNAIFYDSRKEPPGLDELERDLSGCRTAARQRQAARNRERIIASPGIPDSHPLLAKARKKKLEIVSDIELFAREAANPSWLSRARTARAP